MNLLSNRAASYVRTATKPQQDSISNQMCAIREYAKRNGMQIVKEYFDEGKSGLNVQNRESLTQLIRDVQNRQINFSFVLLYDVSVYRLIQRGKLKPCRALRGKLLVPRSELLKLLQVE